MSKRLVEIFCHTHREDEELLHQGNIANAALQMDGAKKRGSRGGSKGGSKGGGKKAKAEDSAATKLRATLSEALAILDWADASEADLETARPKP